MLLLIFESVPLLLLSVQSKWGRCGRRGSHAFLLALSRSCFLSFGLYSSVGWWPAFGTLSGLQFACIKHSVGDLGVGTRPRVPVRLDLGPWRQEESAWKWREEASIDGRSALGRPLIICIAVFYCALLAQLDSRRVFGRFDDDVKSR